MMFGALCMVLIVGINGVPGRFMGSIFDIDNTHLSISSLSVANFAINAAEDLQGSNITSADLHLPDKYSFYLWNYATTTGGKTTYHDKGWDYVKDINGSEVLDIVYYNGSNTSQLELVQSYRNTFESIRDKVRYTQGFFLPTVLSLVVVLTLGIAGTAGYRSPLIAVVMVTVIAFVASLVFAVLITVLIFNTKSNLGRIMDVGVRFTAGTSDLGVVWLCVLHVLAVGVMWLLMALGVMKYNPLLMQVEATGR
jgi:hypothetical protein